MTIDRLQHLALALSVSITMTLNSLLLVTILYLKIGGFSVRYLVTSGIKIAGAVALMGGASFLQKSGSRDIVTIDPMGSRFACCGDYRRAAVLHHHPSPHQTRRGDDAGHTNQKPIWEMISFPVRLMAQPAPAFP